MALVRGVPGSFARALARTPPDPPIDVARARAQHAEYVAALRAVGLEIVVLPADEACPDCCFVEDTAVVAAGRALVTRPGAASRRAEVDAVAAALAARLPVARLEAPATLDGGDCMLLGATLYVGRSARTNAAGIAGLAAAFPSLRVVAVDLPDGVLHLKSACAPLGPALALVAEGTIPPATFTGAAAIVVPAEEAFAANAVAAGAAAVIAAGAPRTRALVEAAGLRALPVETSELRKADGALTCLSILL